MIGDLLHQPSVVRTSAALNGRRRSMIGRWLNLCMVLLLAAIVVPRTALAATIPEPLRSFDTASAAPRPVEETTATAVARDYAHAWRALAEALEKNQASLLEENFTGLARQQWQEAVRQQQQNKLSRRIIDRGHNLRVTFYSLDGSALEAVDTAELEVEYRDGSTVLSSQRVQARYMVLLTPAENSWKVRILQEVPLEAASGSAGH